MSFVLTLENNKQNSKQDIDTYNASNTWTKRGIAYVPARFNVNNGLDLMSALLSVYADGTMQISVGGIEWSVTRCALRVSFALT